MSSLRFKPALIAALSAMAIAATLPAQSQAQPLFSLSVEDSTATVDGTPYSEIIRALTVAEHGRTLVAYDVAYAQALPFFDEYADYLAQIPVETLNRDEQLAYWLNTRNFLLVKGLAEERRIRGFKKKRGTPTDPGKFWTETRITVSGQALSLQDIETQILFAGWDNPNIIFGLYQGVRGGPPLPREPFTGANINAELAEAARRFNSESRNFRVRGETVRISSYFDWYFDLAYAGDEAALRSHLATLAAPQHQTLVREDAKLDRRTLSTEFELYRTRQANAGAGTNGGSTGGARVSRGFGS